MGWLTRTPFEQELMERTIRIESRIVQLGDHVGANLRSKQRIHPHCDLGVVTVDIDSLDVSVSRIFAELNQCLTIGEWKEKTVGVFLAGKQVMTLHT